MRSLVLIVACVLLSGCLGLGKDKKQTVVVEEPQVVTADCYTVDLFTEAKVEKPGDTVPEAYRAFLGSWGKGAWNDVWCHDLLITKVQPDGLVELYDMHAPYEPWGQPATAFRRTARIDKNGDLRFAYGTETLTYRLVDGKLQGHRSGMLGNLSVSLARRGVPPLPLPRYAARRETPQPTVIAAADAPPRTVAPAEAAPAAAASAYIPAPRPDDRSAPAAAPVGGGATQHAPGLPPIPPPRPERLAQAQPAAGPGT